MCAPAIRVAPESLFVGAFVSSQLGLGSRAFRARAATAIIIFLPPGPIYSLNSYVDDNSCLLESSLPHLFFHDVKNKLIDASHRDIYLYQC
jgi:hypothetical protein